MPIAAFPRNFKSERFVLLGKTGDFTMLSKNTSHLTIEFSPRDRKFTLRVGLLLLLTGLALTGSTWRPAAFAPLAIMMGLFLVCLVALASFKKPA